VSIIKYNQCNCKLFGATCMIVTKVAEGVVIQIDVSCSFLQYFQQREKRFLNTKHELCREGGDKTCGDLLSGHS